MKSTYTFTDFNNGFIITGKDRCPVRVRLQVEEKHIGWKVQARRSDPVSESSAIQSWYNQKYNLSPSRSDGMDITAMVCAGPFNLRELIRAIAAGLMWDWNKTRDLSEKRGSWYGATEWAKGKTRQAIASRVRDRWQRILANQFPEMYIQVLRRIFSTTFRQVTASDAPTLLWDTSREMWADILKYPAAAHAALFWDYRSGWPRMTEKNWMWGYSTDGFNVSSSRKMCAHKIRTIMNLPHAIPIGVTSQLRYVRLRQTVTDRSALLWITVLGNALNYYDVGEFDLAYPTTEDLTRAMDRMTRRVQPLKPYSIRRTKDLYNMARYIVDGHAMDNRVLLRSTTVNAALKRAEDAHADGRRNNWRIHDMAPPNRDEKTARPPIDLPTNEGVIFLEDVGQIVDEGVNMGHCVGGYWSSAVEGREYIFHIEHQGERATGAVTSDGHVQCLGPHNRRNVASGYGKSVLETWARKFPRMAHVHNHQVDENNFAALPAIGG